MKKKLLLLIIICIYSCANTDDGTTSSLPPITSIGKNTFGCEIDGKVFLPKNSGSFSAGYTKVLTAKYAHFEYENYGLQPGYHLFIGAFNSLTNKTISIELYSPIEPLISGNTYPIVLKADGKISAKYSYSTNTQDPIFSNVYYFHLFDYHTTEEYNGEITFNLVDKGKKIIAGTFYFSSINPETNKTAEIINGRFDIKYEENF